ncbi:MAG: G1 family glutamic endopeptidase [Candidatus Dormiibacterota bacterium]
MTCAALLLLLAAVGPLASEADLEMMTVTRRGRASVAVAVGAVALLVATSLFRLAGPSGLTPVRPAALLHAATDVYYGTSLDWAGYDAHPGTFTQVSARWTQPSASCGYSATSYASFWAGIDGDGSGSVEQTGTDADCLNGTPSYYGWFELYPRGTVELNGTVRPGDSMSATVTAYGGGAFQLTIIDYTENWYYQTTQYVYGAGLLSAEVIAEAPSTNYGVLPLTDFGTVNFSSATVNGYPIGDFATEGLTMVEGGAVRAAPTYLSGAENFTVYWEHS